MFSPSKQISHTSTALVGRSRNDFDYIHANVAEKFRISRSPSIDDVLSCSQRVLDENDSLHTLVVNSLPIIESTAESLTLENSLVQSFKGLLGYIDGIQMLRDRNLNAFSLLMTNLSEAAKSDFRIGNNFKFKKFDRYALETPGGLKDRACDELVEEILEAYGHENFGRTLSDRRALSGSTFQSPFIPTSVMELVQHRRVSSDASRSAEPVRELLLKVKEEMQDHRQFELNESVREALRSDPVVPGQIVETWNRTSEEPNGIVELISWYLSSTNKLKGDTDIALKLKSEITKYANALLTLLSENRAKLEVKEKVQGLKVSLHEASTFLNNCLLFTSEPATQLAERTAVAAKVGLDSEKDTFVSALPTVFPKKVVAGLAKEFVEKETQSLIDGRFTDMGSIDRCLAILPRIVICAYQLSDSDRAIAMSRLFSIVGFPGWIVAWYEFRKFELQDERESGLPTALEMRKDILAFGRVEGNKIPLPPSLDPRTPPKRRGLTSEEQRLLLADDQTRNDLLHSVTDAL